jgi:hypothetical protein
LAATDDAAEAAAAEVAVCVSESLRTETLKKNMGQCKSEEQDFKKD